jgi:citrate synthase
MVSAGRAWMSAAEASRRLGVKRTTLYAYVSRGLIRSAPTGGATRERTYARDDVERLRRKAEERRHPDTVASHALHLGTPVLDSAISLIADHRLYYRGHDAVELSRTRSVAEVASLIWTGRFDAAPFRMPPTRKRAAELAELPFIARARVLLADAAHRDPLAFDLRAEAVAATGQRILALMTHSATLSRTAGATIEASLAAAWNVRPGGINVLRAAIVLCADHELNVSAFTARCIASAGASPYAAVIGGLSALEGIRHGGMTVRVEAMLESMRSQRSGAAALAERLRQGAEIYGFGHPLYQNGDPRAAELFSLLRAHAPRSSELTFALGVVDAASTLLGEHPTLDLALATLSRVLGLPPRSGLTLFAIGRTIGWIGHAIEQYTEGALIRPRARYVGEVPRVGKL